MKRLTLIILMGMMLTGCQSAKKPEAIVFGTLPAEPSLPIILAKEQGYFDEEGLEVEIIPFGNPQERNAAAQAQEVDGMIGDAMTAMMFRDKGFPFVITSTINEDFKVLSSPNSNITSLVQLDQKQVALIPGLVLEYIMDTYAARENFDYEILNMPSFPGRFEGLLNDQFEGVVFTEPQAGALKLQGAHELASSNESNIKAGSILFKETLTDDQLKAFYRGYNKAVDYLNSTDAEVYQDKLETYQFPQGMVPYINSKRGQFLKAEQLDGATLNDVARWVKEKGLVENPVDTSTLTNYKGL